MIADDHTQCVTSDHSLGKWKLKDLVTIMPGPNNSRAISRMIKTVENR